jgi:hypothetical protein
MPFIPTNTTTFGCLTQANESVAYPREGMGGHVPQKLVRGRPCICPPRFHSTIVMDIPLGRYGMIEYSATFDETRPI